MIIGKIVGSVVSTRKNEKLIGSKFISALITDMISINGTVVDSVIKVYTNGLITGLIILFVLCAVFITGYVLLKKFVLNKKPTEEIKEIPTEN